MEICAAGPMPWIATKHVRSGGASIKSIPEGEFLPGAGYFARLVRYDGLFTTPRHRHVFEQLRIGVGGPPKSLDFGSKLFLEEGDICYFPSAVFYGPQRLESSKLLVVQWADEFVTRKQQDQAMMELQEHGEFHGGVFTNVDEKGKKHNTDGMQAVWEHVYGRKQVFQAPRYSSPIMMRPKAFSWVPRDDVVSLKNLGCFTEREVTVSMVRWEKGGSYELTPERTQLLFTVAGTIGVEGGGDGFGPYTALFSGFEESTTVHGQAGAEAFCIGFPLPSANQGISK